ncbi:MAG: pseudouridine-5'-phosphate glycosidase [Saprospiraceae bacterium]|nr:pseudouridine-5'-phosphate glycosidase [Saprospiraceae bacterium]MDW8483932.1 pseudouridine-5'-phosphate glycosidase [Saprospiraceae bacterium]
MKLPVVLNPEVRAALLERRAVVALESTLIAHGMPYPQNLETALRVEQLIRQAGATPATCAVIKGELRAGLNTAELELLARNGPSTMKVSRRDLGYVLSKRLDGATTVAATMLIAHWAGIPCFATGGIGGVHRGAPRTFDISADLQELARTPVAVVCAGAKSILDIGLTLEYLETFGVPVIGYQTDDFPAFYARTSGFPVAYRLDTPLEVAQLLHAHWSTGIQSGVVVANPIPTRYALEANVAEEAIAAALDEAKRKRIRGKALTPFLLARIEQLTAGQSLRANIELVCHNAQIAAQIALAYASIL